MPHIRFEDVLNALEASIADPANESKKAELDRLSEASFDDTVNRLQRVTRRRRRRRHEARKPRS